MKMSNGFANDNFSIYINFSYKNGFFMISFLLILLAKMIDIFVFKNHNILFQKFIKDTNKMIT
jgi:hypothetical protein